MNKKVHIENMCRISVADTLAMQ